jgi:isochorismate synthase/2-succinyl-5-enolpyruvyl-6-hydroxy-3-cyclohexene-1-carboxylate synthase/2-succinyl-6-hydroxy-2,4-cyclohexadiene-1-carboxylate synthase/O-succinylbenzoate synthase
VTDFTLPLRRPPTTTATATATADDAVRRGWLLKVVLDDGSIGWGEASPLPGLHLESHDAAGAQLRTVASIVDGSAAGGGGSGGGGVFVDATLPLLNGAVAEWLTSACGVREDALLPSVRFALETAVLSALACRSSSSGEGGGGGECNAPLASVLLLGDAGNASSPSAAADSENFVEINALIPDDALATPEDVANAARHLVAKGFRCLKLKVARGEGTAGAFDDAKKVKAMRDAVGDDVEIRCDANRRWGLNDALTFGLQVRSIQKFFTHRPVSTFDRSPFQLTGELFLYGMALRSSTAACSTSRSP